MCWPETQLETGLQEQKVLVPQLRAAKGAASPSGLQIVCLLWGNSPGSRHHPVLACWWICRCWLGGFASCWVLNRILLDSLPQAERFWNMLLSVCFTLQKPLDRSPEINWEKCLALVREHPPSNTRRASRPRMLGVQQKKKIFCEISPPATWLLEVRAGSKGMHLSLVLVVLLPRQLEESWTLLWILS